MDIVLSKRGVTCEVFKISDEKKSFLRCIEINH